MCFAHYLRLCFQIQDHQDTAQAAPIACCLMKDDCAKGGRPWSLVSCTIQCKQSLFLLFPSLTSICDAARKINTVYKVLNYRRSKVTWGSKFLFWMMRNLVYREKDVAPQGATTCSCLKRKGCRVTWVRQPFLFKKERVVTPLGATTAPSGCHTQGHDNHLLFKETAMSRPGERPPYSC